jgi:acyl-CoA oxidase
MSVVWAQLYIDGKCHGVHAYIVPIRDKSTHDLLPGVLIGDCGPKNGHNGIDNGFIMFDKVSIPKDNQLSRISGVDDSGNYFTTIPNEDKRFGVQLSALSGGRVIITLYVNTNSISALAIATRYTLSRRQFSAPKSNE